MRLSMAVLYEYFEKRDGEIWGEPEKSLYLKGAVWYRKGGSEKTSDLIYVGYAEDMEGEPEGEFHGICLIGNQVLQKQRRRNWIYLSGNKVLPDVFNEVQNLFFYYQEWEEELHKALMKNAGIRELCALSSGIFDNMIQVYDRNLFLLATANESKGLQEWEYDKTTGKRVLSMEIINDFKLDKQFKETMSTKGPQVYEGSAISGRVL